MFKNRADAGKKLSSLLKEYSGKRCRIYALPRGGLPVAYEISEELSLPLDILMVKKVGAPYQEELALGAVTEGSPPTLFLNRDLMNRMGMTEQSIQPMVRKKINEVEELLKYYRGEGKISIDPDEAAIIVDDGIATGATVKAAINFFRDRNCRNIVVAVPVADKSVLREIEGMADAVFCYDRVSYMEAVGEFYEDFREITHEQARNMLISRKEVYGRQ